MASAFRFYWVVTVSGGVLMAFEILSSRILSPHFGSSVYVWGSIISVFLGALSLGYWWGGRLADRHPRMGALGRLVVFAALFQVVLLFRAEALAGFLGELTGGSPAGTLLAASALFGPTSVLLGTVSPYAVRLAARDLAHLGNTAGRLYALSTAGSLAGTLICTFLLIPFLGLRQILGLLVVVTALTGAVALARSLPAELPSALLAAGLLAAALPSLARPDLPPPGILYRQITPYQTLQVVERRGVRYLQSDGVYHGAVRLADGQPALIYPRYAPAALLLNPEIRRVLALGMGPGSVGSYLRSQLPGIEVDYVEIDPAVPELARRLLGFTDGSLTRVHIGDARRFLARSRESWDFIFCDTYIGLSVPFHLTTVEFLEEVKGRLAPGGVFGFNLAGGFDYPFSKAIYRTLAEVFPTTYVFSAVGSGNLVVFATAGPAGIPRGELIRRGSDLDRRLAFEPSLAEIARHRLEVDPGLEGDLVLTDAFAPVEHLVHLSTDLRRLPGEFPSR